MAKLKFNTILLLSAGLFAGFCFAKGAEDTKQSIRFVTEHWPPYNYVNEAGKIEGAAVETVKKAVRLLDVEPTIDLYHWAKALEVVRKSPDIFIFSIYPNEERKHQFQWICPLISTEPPAFFRLHSRSDIQINNLTDAKQYITGVTRDGLAMTTLLSNGFGLNQQLYVSFDDDTNLRQLIKGRVDLIVDEINSLNYRLKKLGLTDVKLTPMAPLIDSDAKALCLATHLDTDKALVEKLRVAVQKVLSQ